MWTRTCPCKLWWLQIRSQSSSKGSPKCNSLWTLKFSCSWMKWLALRASCFFLSSSTVTDLSLIWHIMSWIRSWILRRFSRSTKLKRSSKSILTSQMRNWFLALKLRSMLNIPRMYLFKGIRWIKSKTKYITLSLRSSKQLSKFSSMSLNQNLTYCHLKTSRRRSTVRPWLKSTSVRTWMISMMCSSWLTTPSLKVTP